MRERPPEYQRHFTPSERGRDNAIAFFSYRAHTKAPQTAESVHQTFALSFRSFGYEHPLDTKRQDAVRLKEAGWLVSSRLKAYNEQSEAVNWTPYG